jgi:hypothetical protein
LQEGRAGAPIPGLGRFADGQHVFEIGVRPRDYMDRDELAHTARGGRAGIGRGLDRGHVAAHDGRHVAGADLLPPHEADLRGFDHGIGGLDHRHQPFGLDHS